MKNREPFGICICGLNGSGKTTLGRMLAEKLQFRAMDVEDYTFPAGEAMPYSVTRSREEVVRLLYADMIRDPQFVFSAVNGDMGEDIVSHYRLVIYLHAPLEIRLDRVKKRAADRFGERILSGGDLYEREQAFFDFVAGRTPEKVERWLDTISCAVLRLDATESLKVNVEKICAYIQNHM